MIVHPHVHLIVTGGGLSLDGKRWIATDPRFLMHHAGLKKRWKYQVTTRMKEAHRAGAWQFPSSKAFLRQYPCFASMINKLWALIWYAHIGSSLLDPRFSIKYIGRYTKRAVLAEYRITYYDGKIVRFSFKDYAQGGKTNYMTLKVNTFVGRLIRHIPDKYFPMVRYAGIFSNRWKGRYLPQARTALQQPEPMPELESNSPAWAVRQQEYSGTNPLQCPNCHQLLVLVAVLFGPWPRIQRTFRDSGRDAAIPSPLMRPG